jgi:hypothetical protein
VADQHGDHVLAGLSKSGADGLAGADGNVLVRGGVVDGTPVVSTTQYWPGTTSLMVRLASASVVQVLVVVSSAASLWIRTLPDRL